jgi:cellulose synthase/poly-beta-1,6-N-acetylglucosamine synthase-like glycosyltransferase
MTPFIMSKPAPPREGISVVIPVHNGADRLEKIVPAWGDALARLGRDYEIIVIDDGSTDATPAILEKLTAGRVKYLHPLKHGAQNGFGASLKTALGEVKQPLLLYTSLDYPYSPADLSKLLARIEVRDAVFGKQPDLINGCRTGRTVPAPIGWLGKAWRLLWRITLGLQLQPLPAWTGLRDYLYGLFVGWTFGIPLVDVNSKFKLFRTAFLRRVPIQSDSEFVHTELAAKATFLTSIVDEIPLSPATAPEAPRPPVWKDFWRVFNDPDFGTIAAAVPGEPGSTSPPEVPVTVPDTVPDARGPEHTPPASLAFSG